MRRLVVVAWFALVAGPLFSQAPRITPAGDPSVRNDTIYKLAVNPAEYPDDDYVYLLDDGVVRFEPDGRSSRTYRQIVQILNQDGVEAWGEQSFSYSSGSEKLTVNWIRVVKRRSRLILDVPLSVTPRIQERNVRFKRLDVESRGRRVYTWATTDVQKIQGEPFAASPNTLSVHIDVAAPITWADLARWYAKLSAGRYTLTPALEAQLAEHLK